MNRNRDWKLFDQSGCSLIPAMSPQHHYLLSHLIPAAAEAYGDRPATVCGDETLTWIDFDRRVGELAAALRAEGVERGDRVGVYVNRSTESAVSIHAVMRAGAAYVPVDPFAPAETLATIIDDCGMEMVVTHQPRLAAFEKAAALTQVSRGVRALDLTARADELSALKPAEPALGVADDLAYVMYTSGSTGKPKGIMLTHRAGLAYAEMAASYFGLTADDRMANFSPLHFDMSTFELLAGPVVGATAVLIPEPYLRMPASLTEYLETHRVTTMYTVPSLFQMMMSRGAFDQRDFSSVRWVIPAGEAFPPAPLQELMKLLPDARFANVYGPAEVNSSTICDFTDFYHSGGDGPIPIGPAAPDAEVLLVDDDEKPIDGPGTGQLLVRTSRMMVGYWNRPDLTEQATAMRFGPDGRLHPWHRTGDVIERLADGSMIFRGRRDNQVKVRGNRVELEVVESAVGSLPGVENAVVGVATDQNGDHILVAAYTATGTSGRADGNAGEAEPVDTAGWRKALSATLAPYAIPTQFVQVDDFPLTPSGKIDRRTARTSLTVE